MEGQVYSESSTEQYTSLRETFASTDTKVFELLGGLNIEGKRLLDFGAGDGRYALRLHDMGASEVVGVDVSPAMIAKACALLEEHPTPGVSFIEADGSNLPFPERSFDVVFSNFVLHHFGNTYAHLAEIARVMKDSAYLLATFNTFEVSDESLLGSEIPLHLGRDEVVEVRNLAKTDEEVKEALKKAGLEITYYEDQNHPYLKISPEFARSGAVEKVKTIVCLAKSIYNVKQLY